MKGCEKIERERYKIWKPPYIFNILMTIHTYLLLHSLQIMNGGILYKIIFHLSRALLKPLFWDRCLLLLCAITSVNCFLNSIADISSESRFIVPFKFTFFKSNLNFFKWNVNKNVIINFKEKNILLSYKLRWFLLWSLQFKIIFEVSKLWKLFRSS